VLRSVITATWAALLASTAAGVTGCALRDLAKVRGVDAIQAQYAYIAGTVRYQASDAGEAAAPGDAEWMVVYVVTAPCDEDWRELKDLVDRRALPEDRSKWTGEHRALAERLRDKVQMAEHVVRRGAGFWYVRVAPGCYGVGAFVDRDRDLKYDDEPVAAASAKADRLVELGPGDGREGIELVIEPDARLQDGFNPALRQIRSSDFRSHKEQLLVSMGEVTVEGEVADLGDPRFGPESGKLGYFEPYRFLWEVRPGIYFLERYDPDRIPVLFVHGAIGFPRSFETLIAGLDRTRFQPWVAFYPSGGRLASIADYLSRIVTKLQHRHDFEEMAVVAHSMGGLASRGFILRHHAAMGDDPVKVFVSISTPWAGVPSAATGVKRSPFVVPSWRDVKPKSEFIAELFFEDPAERTTRRPLPEPVAHYLIFGVEDKTVPVPSQVRWEAARDARERWPLVYDHTAILESPEASQLLNEILDREFR
jgi:pimeloyl-ACP methyl ester carboxylesterase